jgi:hypothetical protein
MCNHLQKPDLASFADISRATARLYEEAFVHPAGSLSRLYEMGKRDQWNASALPWDLIDFSNVPSELKSALANIYTQTHYGELGALMCTAKAVDRAPHMAAKLFGGTQVMDEARHVEWFTRLVGKLGERAPVRESVVQLITDIYASDSTEELLVGMQVLVEGAAQTLFTETGRLIQGIDFSDPALEPMNAINTVLGDWLVRYVAKDESRHVGFGVLYVAQRVAEMTPRQIANLNAKAERWSNLLLQGIRERTEDFALFGLDAEALASKCLHDQNARLRVAGLAAHGAAPTLTE